MASVIASETLDYPGVAPGVKIIALQTLDNTGNGRGESLERALQCVVANHSAFNIVAVNMAFGSGQNSSFSKLSFAADELAVLEALGVTSHFYFGGKKSKG